MHKEYFRVQSELWDAKVAIIQASYVLVLLLHLIYGLPKRASRVLLAGLRCIIRLSLKYGNNNLGVRDQRLLSQLARDPDTVLRAFNLDPSVASYICCPECYALYEDTTSAPSTCTFRSTAESAPCNAKLWRDRKIGQESSRTPVRKYLHQSLKQWIGRMLSRSDIQDYLDAFPQDPSGPAMKDIFDGKVLHIENLDPGTWPARDPTTHRRSAEEWQTAKSTDEREAIFTRTGGIRYSELLRLPYWNPVLFVVIDSMHNLYLGILKNHIREVWGISVDIDDGDATHARKQPRALTLRRWLMLSIVSFMELLPHSKNEKSRAMASLRRS
ncbi:hypothetical protein A0H81_14995 [Grifola frondosa]|uniref:Uncharacterized protein n=1 Tax=Grifola frondosa TaxID=5627 RepID=A0A1C7LJQ2_GRIFR|nr:hypothetical protein A0H81_14995 [Grifola frondosa]